MTQVKNVWSVCQFRAFKIRIKVNLILLQIKGHFKKASGYSNRAALRIQTCKTLKQVQLTIGWRHPVCLSWRWGGSVGLLLAEVHTKSELSLRSPLRGLARSKFWSRRTLPSVKTKPWSVGISWALHRQTLSGLSSITLLQLN